MKKTAIFALLMGLVLMLSSCEAAGDAAGTVFTVGKWWGILVAVVVIAVIVFLINMFRGKR